MALPSLDDYLRAGGFSTSSSGSGMTPEEKRRKEINDLLLQGQGNWESAFTNSFADKTKLDVANAENQNMSDQMAALGHPGEDGTSGKGFLATALGYLQRPKNAVEGLITGTVHSIQKGLGHEGSDTLRVGHEAEDDADNGFERAWKGLKGEEYGTGDFDWWGRYDENDGFGEKLLKGAADLGIDLLSDPLTYLTFGTAGLGAKAGSELVEGATKAALSKTGTKLGEHAAENAAENAAAGQAAHALESGAPKALESGTPLNSPLTHSPALPGPKPGNSLLLDDAVEGELVGGPLARRAGAARQLGQHDILDAEVIDESTKALGARARNALVHDDALEGDVLGLGRDMKAAGARSGDEVLDAQVIHPLTGRPVPGAPGVSGVSGEAGTGARAAGKAGATGAGSGEATAAANLDEAVKAAVPSPEELAGKGRFSGGAEAFEAKVAEKSEHAAEVGKVTGEDRIARAAASGYALRGGRGTLEGLRAGIKAELPELSSEEAEALVQKVWRELPAEARGQFQVGIFGAKATLGSGGGQSALGKAAAPVADIMHAVKNAVRASKVVRAPLDKVSGATGKEWGDFLRHEVKGAENGMDYDAYASLRDTLRSRRGGALARDTAIQSVLRATEAAAKDSGDEDAFRKSLVSYLDDTDALEAQLPADASRTEKLAQAAAREMRTQQQDLWAHATALSEKVGMGRSGLDNFVEDFIPRVLTKDEKAKLEEEGFLAGGDRIGIDARYSPLGRKSQAYVRQDGSRMTPAEANTASGRKVFEDDPMRGHAAAMNALNASISGLETRVRLENAGLLRKVGRVDYEAPNRASASTFHSALTATNEAAKSKFAADKKAAAAAGDTKAAAKADTDLAAAVTNTETLSKFMGNLEGKSNSEVSEAIGDLLTTYSSLRNRLGKDWKSLTDESQRKAMNSPDLFSPETTYNAAEKSAAEELGFKKVGAGIDHTDNVVLPKAYEGTFGKASIRENLENMMREQANGKLPAPFETMYRSVYKPYLSLAKLYMTLGRGPAYISKNLQGGMYQNWSHGVTAADHKMAAKFLFDSTQSQKEARKLLEGVMGEKPVTGEWAEAAKAVLSESGGLPTQEAVDRLTEQMMTKKLAGKTVGDLDAIDAWKTFRSWREDLLGSHKGVEGALDNALRDGSSDIGAFADRGGAFNLFPGKDAEDLNRVQRGMNKAASNRYINTMSKGAEGSEEFVRGAAFLSGLRKMGAGDGGQGAAAFARGLHFDYGDLSAFERRVMKNVLPFYTWSRMNVPLQLRTLASNPGKFNQLDYTRDQAADLLAPDEETRAKYEAAMPEWLRETNSMVTGMKLFGDNNLALAWDTPQADLDKWIKPGEGLLHSGLDQNQAINGLNPLLKAPMEYMTNTDTFTGASFNDKGVKASGWMQALDKVTPGALTHLNSAGERVMDAKSAAIAKNLVPVMGNLEKVPGIGSASADDRAGSNLLSGLAGVPVATLTEDQLAGEMRSRSDRLDPELDAAIGAAGLDKTWLSTMVKTYGVELTKEMIAAGMGRLGDPTLPAK